MTYKRKILIGFGAIALISGGYYLISPLFITNRVNEKVEDILQKGTGDQVSNQQKNENPAISTVSRGTFEGRAAHSGKGTAILISSGDKYFVRFEDDFEVTNGPDLFVYFGKNDEYIASTRLGALKGNVGGQNYEVPSDINPFDYDEVWVWCRAFSVPFAKAVLKK